MTELNLLRQNLKFFWQNSQSLYCSGLKEYQVQSQNLDRIYNSVDETVFTVFKILSTCIMSKIHSEFKLWQNNPKQNQIIGPDLRLLWRITIILSFLFP